MREDHIVLLCRGNPFQEVWFPPTDNFDVLKIPTTSLTKSAGELAADKARSLGLGRKRQVRAFGRELIGSIWVYVWIVWLKPGDKPTGLRCVPLDRAMMHLKYGLMVIHLDQNLRSRH